MTILVEAAAATPGLGARAPRTTSAIYVDNLYFHCCGEISAAAFLIGWTSFFSTAFLMQHQILMLPSEQGQRLGWTSPV